MLQQGQVLTTVGLLHTVCRQCFTAPQSEAVFKFWHHTAEPLVHSFRPRTGLARPGGEKTRVRTASFTSPGSGGPGHLPGFSLWDLTSLRNTLHTADSPKHC